MFPFAIRKLMACMHRKECKDAVDRTRDGSCWFRGWRMLYLSFRGGPGSVTASMRRLPGTWKRIRARDIKEAGRSSSFFLKAEEFRTEWRVQMRYPRDRHKGNEGGDRLPRKARFASWINIPTWCCLSKGCPTPLPVLASFGSRRRNCPSAANLCSTAVPVTPHGVAMAAISSLAMPVSDLGPFSPWASVLDLRPWPTSWTRVPLSPIHLLASR